MPPYVSERQRLDEQQRRLEADREYERKAERKEREIKDERERLREIIVSDPDDERPEFMQDRAVSGPVLRRGTRVRKQVPPGENYGGRRQGGAIGGFHIDHHKLMKKGIVSLKYPTGKKIYDFPNVEVGPNLRDSILQAAMGIEPDKDKLTGGEVDYLGKLIRRSGVAFGRNNGANGLLESSKQGRAEQRIHNVSERGRKRKREEMVGIANTTWYQQVQIVLGEISAGNDSPAMKRKLQQLLAHTPGGYPLSRHQQDLIRQMLRRR